MFLPTSNAFRVVARIFSEVGNVVASIVDSDVNLSVWYIFSNFVDPYSEYGSTQVKIG